MSDDGAYEYVIESVENAAKTLLMLRDRPSIRAIDVAAELGTARSTAHRMVQTLAHVGLLRQNESDKSYSAGYALVELGMTVIGAADLRTEIMPLLTDLASATGETTHFLVRERDEVLFVAGVEGPHVIRAVSRVGTRLPAHVTSAGKCLLAALPRDELLALYPRDADWSSGTDAAIGSRSALVDELAEVARLGWAVNRSESEPGLLAVSVSVRDARGAPLGAVSVSGPADRLDPRIPQTVDALVEAVRRFERQRARRAD